MLEVLQNRRWVAARRLLLIGIILFLGIRQYGGSVVTMLRRPNPERDIVITHSEFHPALQGLKPAWIIEFRNTSNKFTYDDIQLEATYFDDQGHALETDKLRVKQKLPPGEEKLIGSSDVKSRGAAKTGTLRVVGAEQVK